MSIIGVLIVIVNLDAAQNQPNTIFFSATNEKVAEKALKWSLSFPCLKWRPVTEGQRLNIFCNSQFSATLLHA